MAELHDETSSSARDLCKINVSADSLGVDAPSSSLESGSRIRKSEVNNDQSMNIMSVSNESNNFQMVEDSPDITHIESNSKTQSLECIDGAVDETDRKNLKNKQLDHEDSNTNTTKKYQDSTAKSLSVSETHDKEKKNGSTPSGDGICEQGKKRRGISFPKDTFISSYFDPPDPWKNATHWTTDDLIAAYKKSCEIHGSKPVVKVLQQLHAVSAPGKREESFILRGEKLDPKQVECIEEILRRVQFQLVDLEASHLDDECAVALFDMIEYYESACQLNISSNRNIGARGWQACSRLVRRTPTLNYLDMRNCDLNERTILIFGRALKMGCHLTILHMENMALAGRPLIYLVAALKTNETLQELFLAENKLMPTDGVQLGNLMRYNHKLNLLDLRKNLLQDVGVTHLCDGLLEQASSGGLRTLVLWNNQVTYQAMPALGRVLASSQSVETLNIGHNNITNEGIHLLKDGLLKTTSLLRIGLQGTGVSDEGAVALAEFLADSTMLLRIDLRDNEIKTGGLMALSHAMRVNSSVTRIDLDKDTKKESVIKDYAEQQSRLLRDILTFQQRNIQTAAEREDRERAQLEQLAIEAAEAREKKLEEQNQENPTTSDAGDEKVLPEEEQPTHPCSSSNVQRDGITEKDVSECGSPDSKAIPSVTLSKGEHTSSGHPRPTVLLPVKGLQPQESLDSPQPTSNNFIANYNSTQSEEATPTKSQNHRNLPLVMPGENLLPASTPAEMLLSPQYYPKQLARKIFSVTQVNEDSCSSSALPSSDMDSGGFDPLNVCRLQQDLSSTTESHSTPPKLSSSDLTSSTSLDSNKTCHGAIISPTSLVRDMADETVKQIVSIDEEATSSGQTTTGPDQLCLSSENKAFRDDSLPSFSSQELGSFDTCFTSDMEEISSCDSIMPSCMPGEKYGPCNTPRHSSDNIKETTTSGESSHSEVVSGKGDNSAVDIEEAQGIVPSVMKRENRLKDNLCVSNMDAQDISEKECIASSEYKSHHGSQESKSSVTESIQRDLSESAAYSDTVLVDPSLLKSPADTSEDNRDKTGHHSLAEEQNNITKKCSEKENTHLENHDNKSNQVILSEPITKSESQSSFSEIEPVVDIDNVDLSLEEEPWTAVDKDDDSKLEVSSNQPDFFTTLSMNGLTQELASALTSLDGSSLDEDPSLKPHDEFERELDAMLADVKKSNFPV